MTRNSDKYLHGRFDLSYNQAYQNGINGLVVHKTNRAKVVGNAIWDNGQVSKDPPESRQPYAGLTLNAAKDVEVRDNYVKTTSKDDFAYNMISGAVLNGASGNNKLCKVAAAAGTGFGKVSPDYGETVTKATWKDCKSALNSD